MNVSLVRWEEPLEARPLSIRETAWMRDEKPLSAHRHVAERGIFVRWLLEPGADGVAHLVGDAVLGAKLGGEADGGIEHWVLSASF